MIYERGYHASKKMNSAKKLLSKNHDLSPVQPSQRPKKKPKHTSTTSVMNSVMRRMYVPHTSSEKTMHIKNPMIIMNLQVQLVSLSLKRFAKQGYLIR